MISNRYKRHSEEHTALLKAGTITALKPQARNPSRISVEIEREFAFGLHREIAAEYALVAGTHLSVEAQQTILAAEDRFRCYQQGLRILTRRAHSGAELERKLKDRGFEPESIRSATLRLSEYGYLDDRKFAQAFARDRFINKSYGPERIRQELLSRGLSRENTEWALDECVSDESLILERARTLAEKKLRSLAREQDVQKRRRKLHQFLFRKGYSGAVIYRIINELI